MTEPQQPENTTPAVEPTKSVAQRLDPGTVWATIGAGLGTIMSTLYQEFLSGSCPAWAVGTSATILAALFGHARVSKG